METKPQRAWAIKRPMSGTYAIVEETEEEAVNSFMECRNSEWTVWQAAGFTCVKVTITEGWE
jgi:hypothetical protein